MLQQAANGFGALALSSLFADESKAAPSRDLSTFAPREPHYDPQVTSVIFLYMDGGVSQVDSFDPKPELDKRNGQPFPAKIEKTQFNNIGNTLASPWKFKQYGQSGIPVSELFPHVAQHVDDLAVVRSMVSNFPEHTNANYFLHTGHGQQGRPSMGSWVGYGCIAASQTRSPEAAGQQGCGEIRSCRQAGVCHCQLRAGSSYADRSARPHGHQH
jgi:hypothetical protein